MAWRLTWISWLILITTVAMLWALFLFRIHGFLSLSVPINSNTLLVPGMLPGDAFQRIASELRDRPELLVITLGGPISPESRLAAYDNYADLAAESLRQLGVDPARIVAIPAPGNKRDRTYASACAFRHWIDKSRADIDSVEIYALDSHARRTYILFGMALGPDVAIGVTPLNNPNYEIERWWSSSAGVRTVFSETVAYLYVKCCFSPSKVVQQSTNGPTRTTGC